MPNNEDEQIIEHAQPPDIKRCKIALETLSPSFDLFVLHNWRFGKHGQDEAVTMAQTLTNEGHRVAVMVFDSEYFEKLFIGVPPDRKHDFRAGRPIAVSSIKRENRSKNDDNRPKDTALIVAYKVALQVNALGLAAAQTIVELARNSRRLALTPAAARDKALETLSAVLSPKEGALGKASLLGRLKGLIDRGRRAFQKLFPVRWAREVQMLFKREAKAKLADGASPDTVEAGNLDLLRSLDRQLGRTVAREGAMYWWNREVDKKRPVKGIHLRNVANSFVRRGSPVDLMRAAIAGDTNPSDTYGNLKFWRKTFEAGRKVGVLLRGRPITVTIEDAKEIEAAIDTVRSGRLETEKDGCYHYLADALAKCWHEVPWPEIVQRVVASGGSEIVHPPTNLS